METPRRLHHIALGARDLEGVAAFYADLLGFERVDRKYDESGELRSIWLRAGTLVLMVERTDEPGRRVEGVGAGPFLLAAAVEPEERAEMEDRLNGAGAWVEARSRHSSYVRDPEGNRVAVSHHPDEPAAAMQRRLAIEELAMMLGESVGDLQPAAPVAERAWALGEEDEGISRQVIGEDRAGRPIEAYTFGRGDRTLLFYGFPDPGEAVGGNLILSMLENRRRLEASEVFRACRFCVIPVLNMVDQPDEGRSLQAVHKTTDRREVDWCVDDPRPETTALLDLAARVEPEMTFPLHDEFHADEDLPGYILVDRPLDPSVSGRMSAWMRRFLPMSGELGHPTMGEGLGVMSELADDYDNSTFARLAKHGPVVIPEVPRRHSESHRDLVAAQFGVCGIAAADALSATTST